MPGTTQKKRYEGADRRIRTVALALAFALAILGVRLWDLQVVHWYDYAERAERNRLHPQRLKAARGTIYGRDRSVVLADNRSACDLVIVPAECGPRAVADVCTRLEELIGIDGESLLGKVDESRKKPYEQILVKQDVSRNDLIRVEELAYALPGVSTVARPQRRYLHGAVAGQILGYLGHVSAEEEKLEAYHPGDVIGRDGLEQMYESAMRGKDGQLVVTVYVSDRRPQLRTDAVGRPYIGMDKYGRRLDTEFRKDPQPGGGVFTTLDIKLQRRCEESLEGRIGAITVLDADTGAVLALASWPTYDPSVFVTHGRDRERIEALTAKPSPMRNRCFREHYPPGSVFKVLLASAALEEGLITEHTSFYCPGFYQINGRGRKWHCWKRAGHGTVSIVDALAFSCDVFFWNVGLRLGVDKIHEWATRFGFGQESGLDLPGEVPGLMPSKAWREQQRKPMYPDAPWEWKWYPGNTLNLAIGQGEAATTPLQNAVMMAAIVNGGARVRPYVNLALSPEVSEPLVSERTLALVRAGMRKCVDKDPPAPTGTGNAAKVDGMAILGKTGSAQVVSLKHHEQYESEEDIPEELRDQAWFVAGVLERQPRVAVCVLVEHGHHGSSAAAPVARDVITYFYAECAPQFTPDPLKLAQGEDAP